MKSITAVPENIITPIKQIKLELSLFKCSQQRPALRQVLHPLQLKQHPHISVPSARLPMLGSAETSTTPSPSSSASLGVSRSGHPCGTGNPSNKGGPLRPTRAHPTAHRENQAACASLHKPWLPLMVSVLPPLLK